jgi:hypothetical protein
MGWMGETPWDDDAPLYAESRVAAMAIEKNAGTSAHVRRFVIRILGMGGVQSPG